MRANRPDFLPLESWFMCKHLPRRLLTLVVCFCLVSALGAAECFHTLKVTPVQPLSVFENATRYEITYWAILDGKQWQIFPSRIEKQKDFDLILAGIVRQYLEDEYFAQGQYLDESEVKPASPQEIIHLVGTDFVSKAWGKGNIKALQSYLQHNSNSLELHTLRAYLDYQDKSGSFFSGMDVDPILFRFGATPNLPDEVSIIRVTTESE
jgi:hypothetical protein